MTRYVKPCSWDSNWCICISLKWWCRPQPHCGTRRAYSTLGRFARTKKISPVIHIIQYEWEIPKELRTINYNKWKKLIGTLLTPFEFAGIPTLRDSRDQCQPALRNSKKGRDQLQTAAYRRGGSPGEPAHLRSSFRSLRSWRPNRKSASGYRTMMNYVQIYEYHCTAGGTADIYGWLVVIIQWLATNKSKRSYGKFLSDLLRLPLGLAGLWSPMVFWCFLHVDNAAKHLQSDHVWC